MNSPKISLFTCQMETAKSAARWAVAEDAPALWGSAQCRSATTVPIPVTAVRDPVLLPLGACLGQGSLMVKKARIWG